MSAPESTARLVVSWLDGRTTKAATVELRADGIELDEVVDALLAGLKATTDRAYTVESSEIAEVVRRQPVPPREGVRPLVPARATRGRPAPTERPATRP